MLSACQTNLKMQVINSKEIVTRLYLCMWLDTTVLVIHVYTVNVSIVYSLLV